MSDIFKLPPSKLLLRLLVPIALGFAMLMCIDYSDVVIAGMISDEALAVLGYSSGLIYFMISIGLGLNQGLTITGAEAYIQSGEQVLYRYFYHILWIAFGLSLVLILLTGGMMYYQYFSPEMLLYYDELIPFLSVIMAVIFPTFVLLLVCAVSQIKGKPEVIRDTLALMLGLTILLHPTIALPQGAIFSLWGVEFSWPIGLGLGLTGIAISKGIVTMLGLGYAMLRIFDGKLLVSLSLTLDRSIFTEILKQAMPASLIQSLVPAYLIMLTLLVTQYGLKVLAGFTLGYKTVMLVVVPLLGVLVALMVVITHDMVEKNYARVRETLKLVLSWGSLCVFAVLLATYGVSRMLLTEPSVVNKVALQYLLLGVYITVLEYITGVFTVLFQSVKKPVIAFIVQSFRTIMYPPVVFYYLLQYPADIETLWILLGVSFTLATISSIWVGYRYFWRIYLSR